MNLTLLKIQMDNCEYVCIWLVGCECFCVSQAEVDKERNLYFSILKFQTIFQSMPSTQSCRYSDAIIWTDNKIPSNLSTVLASLWRSTAPRNIMVGDNQTVIKMTRFKLISTPPLRADVLKVTFRQPCNRILQHDESTDATMTATTCRERRRNFARCVDMQRCLTDSRNDATKPLQL